jgi:class 3 adenylate cyclase/tetratricopeptide (TPR) repeat protein
MDIGDWLRSLGLEQYTPTFIDNAIGSDVLLDLTEADLEKLGIPLGDRKRLMKAFKVLDAPDTLIANGVWTSARSGQPHAAVAERRHLTVMICDLVGSTALSARLDPEDMGAVIDAYHAACARITRSYDGFLADFRGDGILTYFGYPCAHEDDAERTVRAGLEIIAAIVKLETRAGEPLAVRIGIATGLVVVGDLGGEGKMREHAVVGDAPNLAARLQGLVEPNTVVVGESTRRLLGNVFRLRDLGRHELKGLPGLVGAWAVEGISASESRFGAVRAPGMSDLFGRDNEIDFLLERQRLAWSGEGQIVLISGEAGIGKSRLSATLAERIADQPHTLLRYQCSPYHTNSSLRPIIDHLERAARFKASDTSEQCLDKLVTVLASGTTQVQAVAPLFAALLSIPFGDRYPPLALSPTQQRHRTLVALLDQFESLARQRPILLLFEDLHWADATSLELLDLTVERVRRLPVIALFTFRTEFEPPWVGLPNVSSFTLGRLDRDDAEGIVTQVMGGRSLPPEVMKQILAKTDGNPLFVEELTKTVLEAGVLVEHKDGYRLDGPLPPFAIPATLHDSLMARLDRLVSVKEIAQIGAAIGREFSYLLIRAVIGRDKIPLKHALTELEQAGLVFRVGEPPEAVYSFKHALVRDAAYESLLKSRRNQLHGQIARVLEEGFADIVRSQPELLAYHFTEAGLVDRAIDYWLKAGQLALSRSANAEAVKHLRQGVELIHSRAPSAERVRKELDFHLALGPAMAATEGHATSETLSVFLHARNLLRDGGTLEEEMTVLWGIHLAYAMGGQHTAAHETAQQCLALAEKYEHPGISAMAHRFMGQTLYFMGAFGDARSHLERTLALCGANQETITSYRRFGADDLVTALSALSRTLWILGFPEQAADAAQRALARARSLGFAFTIAFALDGEALLGILGGDQRRAAAHADEGLAHSIEHSLADYEQRARFIQGALLAQGGDPQHGIELMDTAIVAIERTNSLNRRTLYLGHYAAARASLGDPEAGLDLLEQAVEIAEKTNERFFETELYRLRGKMLLTLGRTDAAEVALRRALKIAQQQQARWWELRAATTLARHWHNEGKHAEAYDLLQPVCGWFVEGLDTVDLQAAKALLDELGNFLGSQAKAAGG